MKIAFVCAEETHQIIPLLKGLSEYSELSVWVPEDVPIKIYSLCGFSTVRFAPKEPYTSWLSSFDAVLYFLTLNSYHKMGGFIHVPGIMLLNDDIPLPTFPSYEEALSHFIFEEHPLNKALFLMSNKPIRGKTLAPQMILNTNATPEKMLRDVFKGIRLAHAFLPFFNFMNALRLKFFTETKKELLDEKFIKEILKELVSFYETYKPFVDSFSQ